jgi:hypothetical protein
MGKQTRTVPCYYATVICLSLFELLVVEQDVQKLLLCKDMPVLLRQILNMGRMAPVFL